MPKRTVDAVVLGTSLFAGIALLGAAVTAFDPGPRAAGTLIGSAAPLASVAAAAPAAPIGLQQASQTLTPFVPMDAPTDGHSHAASPALAPLMATMDGHTHDDTMAHADGTAAAGHVHDETMPHADGMAAGDHTHDDTAAHADGHTDGHAAAPGHGHEHGANPNAVVLADGDDWQGGPTEGWKIQWEPAEADRGSAVRLVGESDMAHVYSPTGAECAGQTPTQEQVDYAAWLVSATHQALLPYYNRPDVALADGFVPYPLGNRYWHMIHLPRIGSNAYTTGTDPRVGSPDSEVLNPAGLESFIYGFVDGMGLVPLGGMYMYGEKDLVPPAPFGCITAWHHHTGSQGFVTSFDPSDPRSVWMVHVWDLPMIQRWGEYDGAYASDWWTGWRYIPSICQADDCLA